MALATNSDATDHDRVYTRNFLYILKRIVVKNKQGVSRDMRTTEPRVFHWVAPVASVKSLGTLSYCNFLKEVFQ